MGTRLTDASQWQQAWTDGGRRAVHIGDVADFNAQFVPQSPAARRQAHHYSCLAAFYTPDPAALLLPGEPDAEWTAWLARELAWGPVELHTGLADEHGTVRGALAARPALREGIERLGLPVRPWGRTEGPGLEAVRHFESKAASHELFARTAAGHPGILVPRQQPTRSARHTARLLSRLARRGETAVLKAHHGVGGYGTAVIAPREIAAAGGARALLRALAAEGVLPPGGGLLVEEYVPGRGRLRNLTFDAVIAEDGSVHPVGAAVMHIDGTSYRGATAGPGAVPPGAAATAEAFGLAVGAELARAGHRGWYDVDFVTDPAGRLAPTEANLRLTGPAVAFVLAARLDTVHGPGHRVRTLDRLPLGARLPQQALLAHLAQLAERCERFGVRLLPTIPTAGWDELPTAGVALAARAPDTVTALDALDAAEAVVRAAVEALADPFDAVAPDAPGVSARPPRGRSARRPPARPSAPART